MNFALRQRSALFFDIEFDQIDVLLTEDNRILLWAEARLHGVDCRADDRL